MPNPKKFDNQNEWMDACMHQQRKVENKEQGQSVAICLNMWRDKNKKSASRVANAFIASEREALIKVQPKYRRTKDMIRQHPGKTHAQPARIGEPGFSKGELVEDLASGKMVPYNPVTMKDEEFEAVKK